MATVAERIKQLRKKKGLSQVELAEAVGVQGNTVSTWERGTRKPDFKALSILCDIFEVSLEYLIGSSEGTQRIQATEEELDELVISGLADDLYDLVKLLCKLSPKSRKIVESTIRTAYMTDREDGTLVNGEIYDISITPHKAE
jgi:transcriptional regulator with XRE-family HTH domain